MRQTVYKSILYTSNTKCINHLLRIK